MPLLFAKISEPLCSYARFWANRLSYDDVAALVHDRAGAAVLSADSIWRLVQERRIDLLVMGLRKHGGLEGLVLGGTAQRLLPEVGCSLLIVKAPGFSSPEL